MFTETMTYNAWYATSSWLTAHSSQQVGRMYDPYTSMFLSPDNYIQAPDNSQSFNRYAYCLNNPLKYTDPDGEFWHIIAGAALGGSMNLIMNWSKCEQWYDFASYFAIGAVAGGLGAGVGAGVSSAIAGGGFAAGFTGASTASATGFVAGAAIGGASGFTGGFITGAGNSLVAGDSFGRSLYNGTIDGAIGLGTGAIIGGVAGGIDAISHERDFFTGSYIQYDLEPALLASTDNYVICDSYIIPDDAYVVNRSNNVVYYKLEEGSKVGIKDVVLPNKYINKPVDGIATELHSDKVYKIVDGMSVSVSEGGYVHHYRNLNSTIYTKLYSAVGQSVKGGWFDALHFKKIGAYADWKDLFDAARLYIPRYTYITK